MDTMRRNLLFSGFGALTLLSGTVIARALFPGGPSVELGGRTIRRWGCQYQNIRLDSVAASNLDLVVLDPIVDGQPLRIEAEAPLRRKSDGARRLVLAYLCVGEAESYRAYWQAAWRETPPAWLGPENPRWPGSFAVKYWHPDWETLLLGPGGALDRIVEAGFDGVFLDRVDAYGDWPLRGQGAQRDMVALVGRLAAAARARKPGFLAVSQNAEHLLVDDNFCAVIDAVSKESLLYGLHGPNVANRPDETAWSLNYLQKAQARGLPILVIEYVSEPDLIARARDRLARLGFVPFFGKRLLDELPGS